MELGNVVNDTYTGVLDITVTLDFNTTGPGAPAARTADAVLSQQDQRREDSDLIGTATLPRNTTETYDGRASWLCGVPRDQRHAKGTQTVRYQAVGVGGCYDHTLSAVNGVYVKDYYRC